MPRFLLAALSLTLALVAAAHAGGKAGVPTAMVDPEHRGLQRWFQALRRAEQGQGVARALHYGDSTIAADGLARTVRARLQERFGDAGPGFVSAAVNDVRVLRADVSVKRSGSWKERSILMGGASGRYGLGGTVGIALPGASSVMTPGKGLSTSWKRVELWYQAGVGYGSLWAKAGEREIAREPAVAEATEDRRLKVEIPEGTSALRVGAEGGPVPLYGAVLETGAPGATWEAQGVIGAGSRSFSAFAEDHLATQMAQRQPDLVVLQIGGNEAGFPVLQYGDGTKYMPIYQAALDRLRRAAPDASCLVIAPPDQAELVEGEAPRAKPAMPRMVSAQRRVAEQSGCAFWSAFDAMGGSGSILRWAAMSPPLAWTDYVHLSPAGLAVVGGHLSDAMLGAYDTWRSSASPG